MKIVVSTSYPLHEEPVVKNRLVPLIEAMLISNIDVELVSPDSKVFDITKKEVKGLFKHTILSIPIERHSNFFKRTIYEFTLSKKIIKTAFSVKADYHFFTVPSMFLIFNLLLRDKRTVLIDIRDLTWEYLSEENKLFKFVKIIFTQFAREVLKKVRFVSVSNETEYKRVNNHYCVNNITLLTNGISQEFYNLLQKNKHIKKNVDSACVITYVGNVGLAQDLTVLVDAAKILDKYKFNIVGDGTDLERVKKYASELNVNNITFYGRLNWDEIQKIYEDSDILYAQLKKEYSGAMPSKLYEYLTTGKFIIYGGLKQAKNFLASFDNNVVIQPDSPTDLVEAIQTAINTESYKRISLNNIDLIKKKYIRDNTCLNYVEIIKGLKNTK